MELILLQGALYELSHCQGVLLAFIFKLWLCCHALSLIQCMNIRDALISDDHEYHR